MLHHNERRLRVIAAEHSADSPRTFMSYAMDTAVGTEMLLRTEGYQPVRHFYHMVRDTLEEISIPRLPAGLEVRPALPEHFRPIWDAEQEAYQDLWGYSPGSEDYYQHWLHSPGFDPSLWRIAWEGEQVVGQVRSFIRPQENEEHHRLRGYTENISVRRPWRNRGVARALIGLSLQAIKERGMTEAALQVDSDSPDGAPRLYEACGFQVVKRSSQYRKPMD